eukprot:353226-Chlamydomonas_euryale.AAC.2
MSAPTRPSHARTYTDNACARPLNARTRHMRTSAPEKPSMSVTTIDTVPDVGAPYSRLRTSATCCIAMRPTPPYNHANSTSAASKPNARTTISHAFQSSVTATTHWMDTRPGLDLLTRL